MDYTKALFGELLGRAFDKSFAPEGQIYTATTGVELYFKGISEPIEIEVGDTISIKFDGLADISTAVGHYLIKASELNGFMIEHSPAAELVHLNRHSQQAESRLDQEDEQSFEELELEGLAQEAAARGWKELRAYKLNGNAASVRIRVSGIAPSGETLHRIIQCEQFLIQERVKELLLEY